MNRIISISVHAISKIPFFVLESYKFQACLECISRNGLSFGHSEWHTSTLKYILNCQKHISQLDHLSEFVCGELRPNCTTQGNESGYALKWSSSKFDNWVALFKGAPQDRTPHWFDDFFEDDVWTGLALGKLWTVDTNIAKKRQNVLGLDENSMIFLLLYCFFPLKLTNLSYTNFEIEWAAHWSKVSKFVFSLF